MRKLRDILFYVSIVAIVVITLIACIFILTGVKGKGSQDTNKVYVVISFSGGYPIE